MDFHCSLSDSKPPQVSRTFTNILDDIKKAIVWIVLTPLVISKSSSPCTNPLVTVPRARITIGIIVTFMLNRVFCLFPWKIVVLISIFAFFQFYSVGRWNSKATVPQALYFLLIIIKSGRLSEIRWLVCISKSLKKLCFILHDRFLVVHIPFVRMVKLQFLAQFPVDHLAHPVVPCLIIFLC